MPDGQRFFRRPYRKAYRIQPGFVAHGQNGASGRSETGGVCQRDSERSAEDAQPRGAGAANARNRQIIAEAERVRTEIVKRREVWTAQQREIEAQRRILYFWAHQAKPPDKN
jgi:hypothetical protein